MPSWFDHVIFINLDSRKDRLQHFYSEWSKISPLAPTRLAAVSLSSGAIGCSMSHIKAIEQAKKNDWPHVIICEDDMTVVNPGLLRSHLDQFMATGREWDVLLLGGNNWPPFHTVDEHCLRIHNCNTTTAYMVQSHYYDTLLQNFKEGAKQFMKEPDKPFLYAIDIWWKRLQIQDRWFLINAPVITQWDGSYSNVENREVSYSQMMLKHDKTEAWIPQEARNSMPDKTFGLMPVGKERGKDAMRMVI